MKENLNLKLGDFYKAAFLAVAGMFAVGVNEVANLHNTYGNNAFEALLPAVAGLVMAFAPLALNKYRANQRFDAKLEESRIREQINLNNKQ